MSVTSTGSVEFNSTIELLSILFDTVEPFCCAEAEHMPNMEMTDIRIVIRFMILWFIRYYSPLLYSVTEENDTQPLLTDTS